MTNAALPRAMSAMVLRTLKTPLALEILPVPTPGPGEILVRVAACGVCHSDLHAIDGDWADPPVLPLIPGHEVTGHVAALGAGVTRFAIGDTVGVPWMYSACGTCEQCLDGMETICRQSEATGYTKPGGYAEYLAAPAAFCARIPDGADLVALAPILCAGVTTYRALKRTGARAGQWVAVIGIGGLGHLAVQYARAMGLRVVAIDVAADKLTLATELGAEAAIPATDADARRQVKTLTGGGVHAAVVAATAPRAFEQSVTLLRPGGTAVFVGIPGKGNDTIKTSIPALIGGELTVRGSAVGTRADLEEAIGFAVRGQVTARVETAPLAEANEVLERMRQGVLTGRAVLVP